MSSTMQTLEAILRAAGEKMLAFADPGVTAKSGHANFVSEADVAVQAFLMDRLSRLFPGAVFLAEEKENEALTDAPTLVIDPIDGTTNYLRHRRASVISVGLCEGRRPVLAAIFNPYTGILYHARRGQGAFAGEEELHVSTLPADKALVGFGTAPYYEELMPLTARSVAELLPVVSDLRRSGSAALDLCDVASGLLDALFEWRLQPWDYCAGSLLVEEAGGKFGSITGEAPDYGKPLPVLAASQEAFEVVQRALRRGMRNAE